MWCNGHKFHIKKLDEKKNFFYNGIIQIFWVTNVSSRSDKHLEVFENRYYGYLDDLLECGFKSFKLVLFNIKWYKLQMNECDTERIVIQHVNGPIMVNTSMVGLGIEPCVLPSQYKHVFYSKVLGKSGWSYLLDMIQEEGQ